MGRFALTWLIGGRQRLADLDPRRDYTIGRDPSGDVVLTGQTVSRRQALLRGEGTRFVLDNRSSINPTTVNGAQIVGSMPLADGARIDAGGQRLTFWDLAAGDTISGPVCSNCGRENVSSDADCWFCGTSLVNAPTGIRTKRKVACRLVGADERAIDLLDQQVITFAPDGTPEPAGQHAGSQDLEITVTDGRPVLLGSGASVEASPARASPAGHDNAESSQERVLSTGDVVRVGERAFVVIVR
jgi:hypothetical protein